MFMTSTEVHEVHPLRYMYRSSNVHDIHCGTRPVAQGWENVTPKNPPEVDSYGAYGKRERSSSAQLSSFVAFSCRFLTLVRRSKLKLLNFSFAVNTYARKM